MDRDKVFELLASGEGQTTEFKETTSTHTAAIKTLAAFASQPQGGTVIFGAKSNGAPTSAFQRGPETSARLAGKIKAANLISMTTGYPLILPMYEFASPDLLAVHVPPGTDADGPYLAHGRRWRRSGSATIEASVDYRVLAAVYQQHLVGEGGNLNFCPECGSPVSAGQHVDSVHDRVYIVTRCTAQNCGWMDYSE